MKPMAISGSGQPMLRRVASSSSTSRIEPIATSSALGLPTRNARSSKMYGMYSTDSATATPSSQSYERHAARRQPAARRPAIVVRAS